MPLKKKGGRQMKQWLFLVLDLVCIFAIMLCHCEIETTPAMKVPFTDALKNCPYYSTHSHSFPFSDGVVVFKGQKKNVYVAVVTSNPVPNNNPVPKINAEQLKDNQVIAIKIPSGSYENIKIGDIIEVNGKMKKVNYKSEDIYFIDASSVMVTGVANVDDPDFNRMVKAIKKNEDQEFFDDLLWIAIINSAIL